MKLRCTQDYADVNETTVPFGFWFWFLDINETEARFCNTWEDVKEELRKECTRD